MEIRDDCIYIDGYPVKDIAEEFGTPTYVYNSKKIINNYRHAKKIATTYYKNFELYYAIKACNNLSIAQLLVDEGAGIDAASINEIYLAQALGLSNDRIIFTGNNLSDEDILMGIQSGAIINLDDETIFPRLLNYGKPNIISFRVNPGKGASALGDYVTNAGPNAKFGIHKDKAITAYRMAKESGITRFGIHMMCGSCILDPTFFHEVTNLLKNTIYEIIDNLGITFEFIDLGGGLGIPYQNKEKELDLGIVFKGIADIINDFTNNIDIPPPKIIMEPARYFVGNAGYLIGRVHTIKEGYSKIIGTDISMNTLARPAMYSAYHHIYIDGKESDRREKLGLCGQVCENTDYWCKDRKLPSTIEEKDLVVVSDAGAYGFSMSYEYNGRLRPAEVMLQDGKPRLIRRRDTFKNMVQNMVLPESISKRVENLLFGEDLK